MRSPPKPPARPRELFGNPQSQSPLQKQKRRDPLKALIERSNRTEEIRPHLPSRAPPAASAAAAARGLGATSRRAVVAAAVRRCPAGRRRRPRGGPRRLRGRWGGAGVGAAAGEGMATAAAGEAEGVRGGGGHGWQGGGGRGRELGFLRRWPHRTASILGRAHRIRIDRRALFYPPRRT